MVVHVFHEPVRRFYDLDSLWGDASRLETDPKELDRLVPPEDSEKIRHDEWDEFKF